jgi:hypothetical protein
VTSAASEAATFAALAAVTEQDRQQGEIVDLAAGAVRKLWRRMRGRRWSLAWRDDVGPRVAEVIASAQGATVARSARYATAALGELGMDADNPNPINPDGFAGVTGSGYPVEDRAYSAVLQTVDAYYQARESGSDDSAATQVALQSGEDYVANVAAEILADAMRAAEAVAFASRPWVDGFIRSPEPGACSRCIVLAGKFYLFNEGFLRHPLCRCNHLPAPPDKADRDRLTAATAPDRYFESLTEVEQNATFGQAGAEAIRAGADIGQVVNARRGMSKAQAFGRDVLVTTEGTTRRGLAYNSLSRGTDRTQDRFRVVNGRRQRIRSAQAPRLMPESLAAIAGEDREEFIRLLRINGFIL